MDRSDDLGNGIVAEPHGGPNGAYAYLDGELVIDLTVDNDALEGGGVSAAAVTGIDDVFTLTNTGNESAKVWLEHDAANVSFRDGGNDPIEGADEAAVLESNESIHVGFAVDARDLEAGETVIESLRFRTVALENEAGHDTASGSSASGDTDSSISSPAPAVEVVESDSKTRTVTVSGSRDAAVPIDLGSLQVGNGVSLEGVTIHFDDVADATFEIRAHRDQKKEESQTHLRPADGSTIGAVTVEDPPAAAAIESVEYRFAVDRDRVEEHASPKADDPAIGFYHFTDGTWERRTLEVDGVSQPENSGKDGGSTDVDRYTATVTADSLSSGVVGVPTAGDESTGADLEPTDSDADESATNGADGSDADPEPADGSGGRVPVAFAGIGVIVVLLRKTARR